MSRLRWNRLVGVVAPLDLDQPTIGAVRVGLVKARFVRGVEEVEVGALDDVPERARQGLHPPAVAVGVSLGESGRDHPAEQLALAVGKAVVSTGTRLIAPPSTRTSTAASASVDGRLDSSSRCRIDPIATSSSSSATSCG
jgi:hypothetical protein